MLSAAELARGVLFLGLSSGLVLYVQFWRKYSDEVAAQRDRSIRLRWHLAIFALMVVLTKVALMGYYEMPFRIPHWGSWSYGSVPWEVRLMAGGFPLVCAVVGQLVFRVEKPVWLWGFLGIACAASALSPDCMELWAWGAFWYLTFIAISHVLSTKS